MSTDLQTYKKIDGVESIVQQLVDNIYSDTTYQEYLKDLEENDSELSTKKVLNIKKTFSDIKVFNSNDQPLFLLNEIGIILGINSPNTMTKNYTDTERITGYINDKGKKTKKVFLTKHGVYRIIFNNKSKLSEVFRGFIYKLIDHMFTHEIETLKSIINEYANDNPQLIQESLLELQDNVNKYKELYEKEKTEKIELETELSFSEMYIEQLKKDKSNMLERLDDRNNDITSSDTNLALEILKKQYLKEFTISLVNPNILDKLFSDNESTPYSIDTEIYILDNYKKGYKFIIDYYKETSMISDTEIFYLSLIYGSFKEEDDSKTKTKTSKVSNIETNTDFVPVAKDYLFDRTKFNQLIDILKNECDHYAISKGKKTSTNFVFKCSLEHIKLISQNLILEH